jgi:hypothetical protein
MKKCQYPDNRIGYTDKKRGFSIIRNRLEYTYFWERIQKIGFDGEPDG